MVDLIGKYQAIGAMYKNLELQLYKFHEAINSHLSHTKIPSLSILTSQSDDAIHLQFLGKKYVIRPDVNTDDENATGLFSCYLIDQTRTDGSMKLNQQVEVDSLGNTRPKGYTDGYPWSFGNNGLEILLTLLMQ